MVGRTPWSAADPPVGYRETCKHLRSQQERDGGVPRGPGGPPYLTSAGMPLLGKLSGIVL
jgi:hypothetical protein